MPVRGSSDLSEVREDSRHRLNALVYKNMMNTVRFLVEQMH